MGKETANDNAIFIEWLPKKTSKIDFVYHKKSFDSACYMYDWSAIDSDLFISSAT